MRALAATALALGPSLAHACAVCGAGEDDPARGAYVVMTLVISALPLGMLGGLVGYLVWKAKAAARAEAHGEASRAP